MSRPTAVPALDWKIKLGALLREAQEVDPSVSHASLSGHRYPRTLVPLLERWLRDSRDRDLRLQLIMSVTSGRATAARASLLTEFKQERDPELKWMIGSALYEIADDAAAPALIRIATKRSYGRSRQMVVMALGKLTPTPGVVAAALGQLEDADALPHAVIAVGKLGARAARPRLRTLVDHPLGPIRRYAKQALERIDRGSCAATRTGRSPKAATRGRPTPARAPKAADTARHATRSTKRGSR
jgi:HEAT repeat protein